MRTICHLAGRIVAVQTKVGAVAGAFCFTCTDHLGNITAMSTTAPFLWAIPSSSG